MTLRETRRLRAFQRLSVAHEKLLLRTLREFLKSHDSELIRLVLASDWDTFHDLVYSLDGGLGKRLKYIFEIFGKQTFQELS